MKKTGLKVAQNKIYVLIRQFYKSIRNKQNSLTLRLLEQLLKQ